MGLAALDPVAMWWLGLTYELETTLVWSPSSSCNCPLAFYVSLDLSRSLSGQSTGLEEENNLLQGRPDHVFYSYHDRIKLFCSRPMRYRDTFVLKKIYQYPSLVSQPMRDIFSCYTRSYAALRAADLDWIVGPGCSSGWYILEKKHEKPTWNHEIP